MRFSLVSLALASVVSACNANANATDYTTIKTKTGVYTGLIDPKYPQTKQFRSIAFAEPPIQARRWLPPQKLPHSTKHHNATSLPPSCPQFISSIPSLLSTYFAKGAMINTGTQNSTSGLVGATTSEDCLYLSIWTPLSATPTSNLPVLVFLPGGGFTTGGIDSGYYDPAAWIERSQSHIVVTINYRLNIFGFPNAPGLEEQNLGILDQRMALEWVRDNIRGFGGDAEAITQWGQSAGAMSTDVHAYAWHGDPIARGYFLMSGTVFSAAAVEDGTFRNFTFVAEGLGCDVGTGNVALLECMRDVPFEEISNFVGRYADSGVTPALSFAPVVDERVVFSDYLGRAKAGKMARIPTIISYTANEASSLVPFPAQNLSVGFPQEVILAIELQSFICPAFTSTLERNEASVPVYRYQYAGRYPNLNPLVWTGAWHGEDIPMVFGTYGLVEGVGDVPEFEVETSRAMQEHILAFMKNPYHGPEELGWNALDARGARTGKVIRFGAGGKAVQYVDSLELDGVCQGLGNYDAFP